jgi:hypothetical protein
MARRCNSVWRPSTFFNQAQFFGPTSVNGNMNSSTFGQVGGAAPPRLMQAAVKLIF